MIKLVLLTRFMTLTNKTAECYTYVMIFQFFYIWLAIPFMAYKDMWLCIHYMYGRNVKQMLSYVFCVHQLKPNRASLRLGLS